MDFGAATHPGYVRPTNEDGFFASREQAVFAVADGMGGHEKGEVASQLALEAIVQHADAIAHATPAELPTNLHQALQDANAVILSRAESQSQDARTRMGTTVVLVTICGDRLYFAHIGDSRLYLLRGDMLIQLTRDHSLVQTMVDRGEITPEEAAIHPLRHQITRVVGGDDIIAPEIASQALEPGDVILLCTDGLSGMVDAEKIKSVLASDCAAQPKADALVKAALDAGGADNITAVVVSYLRPHSTAHRQRSRAHKSPHSPRWQSLLLAALCLLALCIAVVCIEYCNPHYYVAPDKQGVMTLYRDWPMLHMLHKQRIPIRGQVMITLYDARPYLREYTDIEHGIKMKTGKDAGIAFLHKLAKTTMLGMLDRTKSAADKGDIRTATYLLERARALGAPAEEINQLSLQINKAAQKQQKALNRPPAQYE